MSKFPVISHKGDAALQQIKEAVYDLHDTVAVTLGPAGRNVFIQRQHGRDHITKDGVTVLKSIFYKEPPKNMVAQAIKEVALELLEKAGDGTTSSVVIACQLIMRSIAVLEKNADQPINRIALSKSLLRVANVIAEEIETNLVFSIDNMWPLEGMDAVLRTVAHTACNGNELITNMVTDAYENSRASDGSYGHVTVVESPKPNCSIDVVSGYRLNDSGWVHGEFSLGSDNSGSRTLNDPYVIVCSDDISYAKDIVPILTSIFDHDSMTIAEKGSTPEYIRPILIMCKSMDDEALTMILNNNKLGVANIVVCNIPGYGNENLYNCHDLVAITKATGIGEKTFGVSLASQSWKETGTCPTVVVTGKSVTFHGFEQDSAAIRARIHATIDLIGVYEAEMNSGKVDEFKERLNYLKGQMVAIYVGAKSAIERGDLKDSFDDAVSAYKSALNKGVCVGGGLTYAVGCEFARKKIKPVDQLAYEIISGACSYIGERIWKNAGLNYKAVEQIIDLDAEEKKSEGLVAFPFVATPLTGELKCCDGVIFCLRDSLIDNFFTECVKTSMRSVDPDNAQTEKSGILPLPIDNAITILESIRISCSVASTILSTDVILSVDYKDLER